MKRNHCLAALAAMIALTAQPSGVQGASKKYGELLTRLPEQANVLVLVDVDGILDSPMGKREGWRDRANNGPTGVLGVSGDASKFVVAAGLDLQTAQERWKLGMLQTHATPPPLSTLAAREGGYVEQIQTHNVAWTPRDVYLLSFPQKIVGFVAPANRQLLADWLYKTLVKPRPFPPGWADKALIRADAGSQIVLAVDLADSVSSKGAIAWLKTLDDPTVKLSEINFPSQAGALSGAKLAFLQIDIKDTIHGSIQIEFDSSLTLIKPIARQVVLEILEGYGASLEDIKKWSFGVDDKTITMSGAMDEDSVRRILSIVAAPRLTPTYESAIEPSETPAVAATKGQQPTPPQQISQADGLKATQRYYAATAGILRDLKRQTPKSSQSQKLWYDRSAKEIEELPLLYVDTDLLDWGAKMALNVRQMASGINYAAKDRTYRTAGLANGYYGGYGYGVSGSNKSNDAAVLAKQYNSVVSVQVDQGWQAIETSISDMRRQLTTKYKVEF
ncbi:hypothetical protein EP7_000089 [Isosphaeraceae bacterium EP7]